MNQNPTTDQPVTAATQASSISMTNEQRVVLLRYIDSKLWGFDMAGKVTAIWDAVLGEDDWDELSRPVEPMRVHKDFSKLDWTLEEERYKAAVEARTTQMKESVLVQLDVGVMRDLRDLIRKKLESVDKDDGRKEKTRGEEEFRWQGRLGLEMNRLWARLDTMLK